MQIAYYLTLTTQIQVVRFENCILNGISCSKMYVIINLMHLVSQISGSQHSSCLLLDFDYSYTSCKYILDNMMSVRS